MCAGRTIFYALSLRLFSPLVSALMADEKLRALRAQTAAIMSAAEPHAPTLLALLTMDDATFAAHPLRRKSWFDVLQIKEPEANKSMLKKVSKLRELFMAHAFLLRDDKPWLSQLALRGRVVCFVCYEHNTKSGKLLASTSSALGSRSWRSACLPWSCRSALTSTWSPRG